MRNNRSMSRGRRFGAFGVIGAALALSVTSLPAAVAADEPIENVSSNRAEYAPNISVSFVPSWNSKDILNDGAKEIGDFNANVWGTWSGTNSAENGAHWAVYDWEVPVVVSSSNVWFWQNPRPLGDGGVMVPQSWKIQYKDGAGSWQDIEADYQTVEESTTQFWRGPYSVTFEPVKTNSLRLMAYMRNNVAIGVTEWEAFGYYDPSEPNTNLPLLMEEVNVRTAQGEAPDLPDHIWGIPEDGPLRYYDVTWNDVAPNATTATGTLPDFDEPVTARIFYVDDLDAPIDFVEYSSTITRPTVAPVCPKTVLGDFEDASTSSQIPVTWETPDASLYAEAESIFDVTGTVEGYDGDVLCTVVVVEPSGEAAPVANIVMDAPAASGWYTETPKFTVEVDEGSAGVASVEYKVGDAEWVAYEGEVTIDIQGEVTIAARATDENGVSGETARAIKIDTIAPTVDAKVTPSEDNSRVTVELTADDGELGSGVTRVLWASGDAPDNPTTMWATYEGTISVNRGVEDSYVIFYAQDAAGLDGEWAVVKVDKAESVEQPIELTTAMRCVAGKTVLTASVANKTDAALEVEVVSPYGSKTVTVAAGKTAAQAFSTRAVEIEAGKVTAKTTVEGAQMPTTVETSFDAFSCSK